MHFQYALLIARKKYAFSICIFDGSKIFQKYAFFHGKMHICLLFGWLQKMQYFIFRWFCPKKGIIHGIMHFWWLQDLEICIFPWENAYLFFRLACRKMHISEKSWSHQKCIIPWKPWFLDKINEIWTMHFLQPAEKQICMHFPMEKCIFLKNLGAIKNA